MRRTQKGVGSWFFPVTVRKIRSPAWERDSRVFQPDPEKQLEKRPTDSFQIPSAGAVGEKRTAALPPDIP